MMNQLLATAGPGLAWALLDFVWQGLLVAWGAALLLALLRKARPQVRYAVACAALLLCAALPLAGTVQRVMDAQAATTLLPLALAGANGAPGAGGAAPVMALGAERLAGWAHALQARLPLVILFWSCGAGLLALRMMLGLAWVRQRSRPGRYRTDPAWQARLDRLAGRFGIARPVVLGLVDDLASPVTAGWWRPVVLVPASLLSGMPPDLLEALLAHELAHVRRLDYVVNLVQGAIEILLFYHPAVWWLSNRIRLEREQIADDLAASMLGEPRRLALALSELDLFQLATPQLAQAAHGGNLMSRIKRLVRPETEPLNWKMALPILGLAACAALYAHTGTARAAGAAAETQTVTRHGIRMSGPTFHGDAYALVRAGGNGTNMSGDSANWSELEEVKKNISGEFLWFREGGKAWVIQEPDVLAKARAAWAPVDRLGEQMDGYGKQMDQRGKVMEALGKEMEQAAAGNDREMRQFGRKMEALGRQMDKLGRKFENASGAERDRIESQMEEVGGQMKELGRQLEKQQAREGQRAAHASMDEVGRRMHDAGKPMDALGKQMDVLGKQMDKESHAADKIVRGLIREAQAKGLARPAPARS